jgi:hypothetical protein
MGGFIVFLVLPILFGGAGPRRVRQRVGDFYIGLSATAADRFAIVIRKHGGLELQPMRFDVEKGAEKLSIGGEDEHITDDLEVIGRLRNQQFGILDEGSAAFTDCLWAEVGDVVRRCREQNALQREVWTDGGEDGEDPRLVTQFCDVIPLDGDTRLTTPSRIRSTLAGNRKPTDGETAYEQGIKSQEKFGRSVSIGQSLTIGIMFAIGAAMIWFVVKYGGTASSAVDGVSVPIQVAAVLAGGVA